jgi:hypothetical protein
MRLLCWATPSRRPIPWRPACAGIGELIAHFLVLRCGMTLQQARERCLFLDSRGLVCKSRTGGRCACTCAACRLLLARC